MLRIAQGFIGQRFHILPFFVVDEMESDDLTKDIYMHSLGYYPNAKYHYFDRPNGCAEYIIIYCVKGKGWYTLDGKKYLVSENQVVILPPFVSHSYGADESEPWSIYWVHFKGSKAAYFSFGFTTPVNVFSRVEYRIALFDEIYNTLKLGYNKDNLVYACAALCHFLSTFRCFTDDKETKNDNELGISLIHWVTHFMSENIDKKLKLEDFAAFTKYSTPHFYRLFYKATGYAPMTYFLHLKMDRACHYLLYTTYKVNQIAQILGFNDACHFSKLFSKIKKVSPNQYRKRRSSGDKLLS